MKKIGVVFVSALLLGGCADAHYRPYCPDRTCNKKPVNVAPTPSPAPVLAMPMEKTVLVSKPITISGINFNFNKAILLKHDIKVADQVAEFAKKNPTAVLQINGYCSKVGSYSYNQKLSLERARAVKNYLEQKGVPASHMKIIGHSYNDNVATNSTPQGRFENQRVTISSSVKVKKY